VEKKEEPMEDSEDQNRRDRRLRAQLLAADALFEAARAGERGEAFGRVIEAWMDWFMSDGGLKEEGAGPDLRPGRAAVLQDP
jgi:hypothetical protein